jgi:outer membrane immunogenic protein
MQIPKSGIFAAALMTLSGAAQAADLTTEPMPVSDWNGFYIGLHVGAGGVDIDGIYDSASSDLPLGGLADVGFLGGVQGGFNFQTDSWVFGVEADISAVDWDDSAVSPIDDRKATFDADFLASIRGRIGIAADTAMFYVTGGIAFLEAEWSEDEDDEEIDVDATGGVVGAGVEWAFSEHFTVRGEGLYYFFNDETSLEDLDDGDTGDHVEIENAAVGRIGVNWIF